MSPPRRRKTKKSDLEMIVPINRPPPTGFEFLRFQSSMAAMKLVGVTGGVGMGKSACAQLLRQRGVLVVDTDELARQVVEPGQSALKEIEALFGTGVIGSDGKLRRGDLARLVFSSD